jgi:hypothetical protein
MKMLIALIWIAVIASAFALASFVDSTEPPATPCINAGYYYDDVVFETDGKVIQIYIRILERGGR